jgi:2-oxo-4-hydroxy-4-carboxy-5-ureidoimidazoline decarboxylase
VSSYSPARCVEMNAKLIEEFTRVCGSPRWVDAVISKIPFSSLDNLIEVANSIWWSLPIEEWKLAFAAHPKIGDGSALKEKFSKSSWEGEEQKGADNADENVLNELAAYNTKYEDHFGFIFLICATGKTALEMLEALKARIDNDYDAEIKIAVGEQAKIIRLRLIKLFESIGNDLILKSRL